jgi:hypothetical protein
MMGGEAFILLKTGRHGPESTKQAEIRLAILLKILQIAGFLGQKPLAKGETPMRWLYRRRLPRIWLTGPESRALLSRSQF